MKFFNNKRGKKQRIYMEKKGKKMEKIQRKTQRI